MSIAPLTDGYIALRRPHEGDVSVIARHINRDDAQAWLSGAGDAEHLYGEYMAGWLTPDKPNRLGLTLAVTHDDGDELIGVVHLESNGGTLDVSYGVAPDYRLAGVASHVLALCSGWALEHGFSRVELDIGEDNAGSQAVARRCGFQPTDRTRCQTLPDGGTWHARAWTLEA